MAGRGHLSDDGITAALDARDEWAVLTTIDADGYPHSVPLGYYRIGRRIYLGTPAGTHKVNNAERNPKASVLVARHKASGEWSGVLLQGDVTIIRDAEERLQLEREARRQRGVPEAELPTAPRRGEVILGIDPRNTITWRFG